MNKASELDIGREALVTFGAKMVLAAIGFVGVVIFARELGPDLLGVYFFLIAGAKLSVEATGGVATAVKKRVSEVNTEPGEYLTVGLVFHMGLVIIGALLAVLLRPLLERFFGPAQYALWVVLIVAALGTFAVTNRLYSGIGHPGASQWVDAMRSLLTLAVQLLLLFVAGFGVFGLVLGLVVGTIISAAASWWLSGVRPRLPTRDTIRWTAAFAKWSVPNGFMQKTYDRVDVLIVGALVGSGAVGLYEPALRLTVPATFVAIGIGNSLVVKASALDSLDRDVVHDLRNAVSYTCLLSIPIFFGALAMPRALMSTVFGPGFGAGWLALVGLAGFQFFNTLRMPFSNVFNGVDRPDLQFRVGLFTLMVHLPLAVGLGIEYGLAGVVAATVIAEAGRVFAYEYLARELFGKHVLPRPLGEQIVAGGIMFLVVAGLRRVIAIGSWVPLFALVGVGAVVYFGSLTAISGHFRLTVKEVLGPVYSEIRSLA